MRLYIIIPYVFFVVLSSAHMALYRPIPRGGIGSDLLGGRYSATVLNPLEADRPMHPCLRFQKNLPITLHSGDIYNVRFYAGNMRTMTETDREGLIKYSYKKWNITQGRHGGGECHFYISYDYGSTGREIARYTKTCPDIYYNWSIMIPYDISSCVDCLLVWVWYAYSVPQSYVSCTDVNIESTYIGPLPSYQPIPVKYPTYKVMGDGLANGLGPLQEELIDGIYRPPIQTVISSAPKSRSPPRLMDLLDVLDLLW